MAYYINGDHRVRLRGPNYFAEKESNYLYSKYSVPKWIQFCKYFLSKGFRIGLYQAPSTNSKYVYVISSDLTKHFKIRFSDHKPIKFREIANDCDFFVGVANYQTTTTRDAAIATLNFFGVKNA